jgi:hypothetical protein
LSCMVAAPSAQVEKASLWVNQHYAGKNQGP